LWGFFLCGEQYTQTSLKILFWACVDGTLVEHQILWKGAILTVITVYSQPNCVPCKKVKTWLDNKEIAYVEKDVTADVAAYNEVKSMGYSTMPVVQTETRTWSGIDLAKMKSLLV
jgi:glutaredoxin-like protein NrdH